MTNAPVCPETGKLMVRDSRPMTIKYKGESSTFDMPGWYSPESGESIHTSEDLKVSDRVLKALKIKVENLLSPDEVRRIRTKFGLSQREASAIIGGGPNAFQKYESGEILLSKGMSHLLRMLERHPEEIEELKEDQRRRA